MRSYDTAGSSDTMWRGSWRSRSGKADRLLEKDPGLTSPRRTGQTEGAEMSEWRAMMDWRTVATAAATAIAWESAEEETR